MSDDVAARELECECDCIKKDSALLRVTDNAFVRARTPVTGEALTWPAGMGLAERLDALADQVALVPPKNPSERVEVGQALARYMLGARDGETATAIVRRVVDELGWAEAMSAGEVLAEWALSLAVEAEKAKKAGRR